MVARLSLVFFMQFASMAYAGIGFKTSEDKVYTLYRNSAILSDARIHFATFDADDSESYNKENCEKTSKLIMTVPSLKVKYWCEKSYFKE